ncbi:hypothetical protein GGR54DRAFT_620182 [Hypoxylon sp. NC1633]|nr:hypothetical protein GGR54DRAFT_620182 [Hypoxylon sp. NC1633]
MEILSFYLTLIFANMGLAAPRFPVSGAPKWQGLGNATESFFHDKRQEPVPTSGTYIDTGTIVGITLGSIAVLAFVVLLIMSGRRHLFALQSRRR